MPLHNEDISPTTIQPTCPSRVESDTFIDQLCVTSSREVILKTSEHMNTKHVLICSDIENSKKGLQRL